MKFSLVGAELLDEDE